MRTLSKLGVVVKICLRGARANDGVGAFAAVIAIAFAAIISVPTTGCGTGLMSKPCAEALTYVASTNAMLAEASAAVDQAHSYIATTPDLSKPQRKKGLDAVYAAKAALQVASKTLSGVKDGCEKPDIRPALQQFAGAWAILRSMLSLFGGTGSVPVEDPQIFDAELVK